MSEGALLELLMDFVRVSTLLMSLHLLHLSPQLLGCSLSPLQQVGFSEFPCDQLEVTWLTLS